MSQQPDVCSTCGHEIYKDECLCTDLEREHDWRRTITRLIRQSNDQK